MSAFTSRRAIKAAAFLTTSLALASSASAEIVDLKWKEGGFSHKSSIAPKKFLEVCGKLNKGENIGWRFNGSAPTDFNIHYHVGNDVVYPEQRKGIASAESTLVVPLDQDFCWMWSNRGATPIEIELNLSRKKQ
jgi:hypothetical protein